MNRTATAGRPTTSRAGSASLLYRRRRRRWPFVLIGVLVLALAGTAVWLVGFSTILATKRVEVRGIAVVGEADVRAAAAVPLDQPLARQDIDGIAGRVAELTPVESVEVTRQYPDTIVIMVHERTAVIAVDDGDAYLLLDRHGVPYRRIAKLPAGVLLVELNAGNTRLAEQVGLVAAALPEVLRKKVEVITAPSESSIELELTNGDRVIWGTADESALKATVLLKLLERKGKVYNVSAPHHPAIR